jgi:di- and tripeptidase
VQVWAQDDSSSQSAPSSSPSPSCGSVFNPDSERLSNIKKPLYIREGGSIPGARFLEKEFGAPAAHLPCGQSSDMAHLDNERLRLVNLYKVCDDPPFFLRKKTNIDSLDYGLLIADLGII